FERRFHSDDDTKFAFQRVPKPEVDAFTPTLRHRPDAEEATRKIRAAVSKTHGVNVSAVIFVKPGTIPKTRRGKIQRLMTKKAFLEGSLDVIAEWQEGEDLHPTVDKALGKTDPVLEMISRNLRISVHELNPDCSLTSYGLDSLSAVQLAQQLEDHFKVEV